MCGKHDLQVAGLNGHKTSKASQRIYEGCLGYQVAVHVLKSNFLLQTHQVLVFEEVSAADAVVYCEACNLLQARK